MSLDERIFQARRAACRDALVGAAQPSYVTERWCDGWEREAALDGRPGSGEFWLDGRRWIDILDWCEAVASAVLVRR